MGVIFQKSLNNFRGEGQKEINKKTKKVYNEIAEAIMTRTRLRYRFLQDRSDETENLFANKEISAFHLKGLFRQS